MAVAGVIGVAAVATLTDGGPEVRKADAGGGALPGPSAPPAPYAISTLPPVGTAAQDPGGGGGGTGAPGTVAGPAIQGPQGSGSPQGPGGNDGALFLSGPNLLDPSRSATTSGETTIPSPLTGVGGIVNLPGGGSSTGCARDASSADYYAVPLKVQTVGFNGAPSVRIRISGGGTATVRLEQMAPDGSCQTITSGSGPIRNGVAEFSLGGVGRFQFAQDNIPALVISAPGSHTISTSFDDPSFVALPGLYGV